MKWYLMTPLTQRMMIYLGDDAINGINDDTHHDVDDSGDHQMEDATDGSVPKAAYSHDQHSGKPARDMNKK